MSAPFSTRTRSALRVCRLCHRYAPTHMPGFVTAMHLRVCQALSPLCTYAYARFCHRYAPTRMPGLVTAMRLRVCKLRAYAYAKSVSHLCAYARQAFPGKRLPLFLSMIGEEIRKLSVALCTVQSVPVCGALYRVQFVPVSALCTVSSVQTHIVSGTDLPYGATACLPLAGTDLARAATTSLQHLRISGTNLARAPPRSGQLRAAEDAHRGPPGREPVHGAARQ
eukprot:706556-Rhodomonas_salina.1